MIGSETAVLSHSTEARTHAMIYYHQYGKRVKLALWNSVSRENMSKGRRRNKDMFTEIKTETYGHKKTIKTGNLKKYILQAKEKQF